MRVGPELLPALCPAPSRRLGVLWGPGGCHRAGEHRAEPGPRSGRGVLAGKVLGWERGASPVSHPSIFLLIPLCWTRAWSPWSPGGWFQLWSPQGQLRGGGGMGGMCTCFPQHQQLCSSTSGWVAVLVASPRQGESPQHPWPEPPHGACACPQQGGGERGRVGAMLGPSVSSYGRGYGTARRLRFF